MKNKSLGELVIKDFKENYIKRVILIIAVLGLLFGEALIFIYFSEFNGEISSNIDDWNMFSSYFNVIGLFMFGSTNVLLLYYIFTNQNKLSKEIVEREIKWKIFEKYLENSKEDYNKLFKWHALLKAIIEGKEEYVNYSNDDKIGDVIDVLTNVERKAPDLLELFIDFLNSNKYLFDGLIEDAELNEIDLINPIIESNQKLIGIRHSSEIITEQHFNDCLNTVEVFLSNYDNSIRKIHKHILGK